MNKKAQTATEYLIILAVVIIIALIVVGVMGGIPGIGGGAGQRTSMAYWSTADVAFTSYAVDSSGAVTLAVRNNNVGSITITSISLGGFNLTLTPLPPLTLTSGGAETLAGVSASISSCSGSFSYPVVIVYTDVETGESYTFNGDGQTLDGACAN